MQQKSRSVFHGRRKLLRFHSQILVYGSERDNDAEGMFTRFI